MNAPRAPLRSLDEALQALLAQAGLLPAEPVSTFDADGRVLAEDLVSSLQVPPQDNSSMDGYAVRRGEIADEGVDLPVSQRIPAGAGAQPLQPGTIARIFTGAPVPAGADAIVMQEDTEVQPDGRVRILRVPSQGQWIRRSGEDITRGSTVLARGTRIGPAAQGLAASIGRDRVLVARRPRVALFSTGDELVMPGTVPPERMRPGAIYNSNRFILRGLLQSLGCEVQDLGIVPDTLAATREALRNAARQSDLIITSGGVSVGEEDHVRPAVEAEGRINMWQIAIKPGKPLAFGEVNRSGQEPAFFLGLPGNPVSSFVTFLLFVRPFLLRMQGVEKVMPDSFPLRADFDWSKPDRRNEFLRARVNADGGLDLFPNQGSAVLTSAVWGSGLIDCPPGQPIKRGELVRFIPFSELNQ